MDKKNIFFIVLTFIICFSVFSFLEYKEVPYKEIRTLVVDETRSDMFYPKDVFDSDNDAKVLIDFERIMSTKNSIVFSEANLSEEQVDVRVEQLYPSEYGYSILAGIYNICFIDDYAYIVRGHFNYQEADDLVIVLNKEETLELKETLNLS